MTNKVGAGSRKTEVGLRDETRAVRSGLTAVRAGEPLHAGPMFVSTFHTPGEPDAGGYSYGGAGQPGWTALERALGELEVEAGQAAAGVRVFASGSAALAATFGAVLRPGDTVVLQREIYYGAKGCLEELFVPNGVMVREVGREELGSAAALAGARLVWVETPANPRLEVVDVRAVVGAARTAGALVAMDNTAATPLGQRPLALGVDFSVCSDSKALGGHSDLLMGHVAVRSEELLQKLHRQRGVMGAGMGPMEAWLALRSLATLPLRLERMCGNALAVALFLQGRREVAEVLYPGLPGHPGHAVAAGQMRFFGPLVSFTLAGKEAAERFLERSELVTVATSFGGITTTAERRGRWGRDAVVDGFIRMSVGCEAVEDLIEDMGRALDGI